MCANPPEVGTGNSKFCVSQTCCTRKRGAMLSLMVNLLCLALLLLRTVPAAGLGAIGKPISSSICRGAQCGSIRTCLGLAKKDWSAPKESPSVPVTQTTTADGKGLVYSLELSKRAGISWGSDISFRWIYVLDLEPTGEAAQAGVIQKGDYIIQLGSNSTVGQDFDFVLSTLNKQAEARFNYTFFRGTREQLLGGDAEPAPSSVTVRVTVQQEGRPDTVLTCPGGTNLRRLLVGNGINVYRSLTRWTNCNGQQRCGTCIVDVTQGLVEGCSRRDLSEEAVLRENPETYRLSCVTSVYKDVTVKVQTPVGAAQWTR